MDVEDFVQRGFNLSDKPKKSSHFQPDAQFGDVRSIIRLASGQSAMVAGHDCGGA